MDNLLKRFYFIFLHCRTNEGCRIKSWGRAPELGWRAKDEVFLECSMRSTKTCAAPPGSFQGGHYGLYVCRFLYPKGMEGQSKFSVKFWLICVLPKERKSLTTFIDLFNIFCSCTGVHTLHIEIISTSLSLKSLILQDLTGMGQRLTLTFLSEVGLECVLGKNMLDWKYSPSCTTWWKDLGGRRWFRMKRSL